MVFSRVGPNQSIERGQFRVSKSAPASRGAVGILSRLIARLRQAFPKTRNRVRLDGGFASPEVLNFLDGQENL